MPKTKPAPIALVVCDNVYREPSGKKALMGLFDIVFAPKFPAAHPKMCIYVSVTDIRPNSKLRIDIVFGETDEPLLTIAGDVPKNVDPTAIVDLTFNINNLVFPKAGTYFVRFWGNDHCLLMRPIKVKQVEGGG